MWRFYAVRSLLYAPGRGARNHYTTHTLEIRSFFNLFKFFLDLGMRIHETLCFFHEFMKPSSRISPIFSRTYGNTTKDPIGNTTKDPKKQHD